MINYISIATGQITKIQLGSGSSSNIHSINVSDPWFTLISLGLKTVEGRKNKGIFKDLKQGDIIEWINNDFGSRSIKTRIIRKTEYKTFEEYLLTEGLDKTLPSISTLKMGLDVYFKYYTKEDEKTYGVAAIHIEKI